MVLTNFTFPYRLNNIIIKSECSVFGRLSNSPFKAEWLKVNRRAEICTFGRSSKSLHRLVEDKPAMYSMPFVYPFDGKGKTRWIEDDIAGFFVVEKGGGFGWFGSSCYSQQLEWLSSVLYCFWIGACRYVMCRCMWE